MSNVYPTDRARHIGMHSDQLEASDVKLNWTSYSHVNPSLPCTTVEQQKMLVRNRSKSGRSDNPWKHADAVFNVTLFKEKVLNLLLKTSYWKQFNLFTAEPIPRSCLYWHNM